jgi:hypothetical protein
MEVGMRGWRKRTGLAVAGLLTVVATSPARVAGQEVFQFVVAARDANGQPVTDLKRDEVVMSEGGVANDIVKIEPFHLPVKLTIAVDNGILSRDALGHYRNGLEGLVKALPPEVEVAVIAMAPQPRTVQAFTTDRIKIVKGISAIAPDNGTPRFADTLVEYSKRLKDEFNKTKKLDSIPVLVLVSTTAPQNSSYQATEIDSALQFMEQRKTRVYVTMSTQSGIRNEGDQPMIAIPLAKGTHGRYEALADSSRLASLLPEYGADIASLHQTRYNQVMVTAARKNAGPLQDPRIELTRPNLQGEVSVDGFPSN